MFIVTRFSKYSGSSRTYHGGSVEGMTKNFEQAKEMLIKLQILASIRRKKEREEEDKDTDTSKEIWSDRFVISHAVEDVGFTSYSTSYKDVMKD
jgi:hypothetical protein